MTAKPRIVIITGVSGSGKSTAIKALEDVNFYCIDNLPVTLLPKFVEVCSQPGGEISRVALVMDLRERDFLTKYRQVFTRLKEEGQQMEILFLEASDAALIRRFQETRRPHPLGASESLVEDIRQEKEKLKELRDMADWVVDTSELTVHQLKRLLRERFGQAPGGSGLVATLVSFGFRYGLPLDADLVMDVRFLPNPFFSPGLKLLTGEDEPVVDYILADGTAKEFVDKFKALLDFLLPLYRQEGKAYLTLALGCTGGRHRSVTMVNQLARALAGNGLEVRVRHRDVNKEVEEMTSEKAI